MHKAAIVIATYTGGEYSDVKASITKNLCKVISENASYYICLVSHSPIDIETQQYCNAFIYDSDNSFQINGLPKDKLTHGMAELTSMHNAVNYLQRLGFTHIFKLAYDCDSTLDYNELIQRCQYICDNYDKRLISNGWGNKQITVGTLAYYCEIDFFKQAFSLEKPEVWHANFEMQVHKNICDLGLLDKVYLHSDRYFDGEGFLGFIVNQYVSCSDPDPSLTEINTDNYNGDVLIHNYA